MATEEYEQGNYVYFDFSTEGDGWCERVKPDFAFEYSCLEEEFQGVVGERPPAQQQQR